MRRITFNERFKMQDRSPTPGLTRRQFLKYSSVVAGVSFMAMPQLVHAVASQKINLRGFVQSGDTTGRKSRFSNATVNLYWATSGAPQLLATTTTNPGGVFQIQSKNSPPAGSGIFYVTADISETMQFACVLGSVLPQAITVNELTTVAAGFALAQFISNGVITGNEFGLQIAAGMNDNLVSSLDGTSSLVMRSSPNGDQTNSWRSTHSVANLLAGVVQSQPNNVNALYSLTTPPGGVAPVNFLQAITNICLNPAQNVSGIFNQSQGVGVYKPELVRMPDAWTIAVKVNDTGNDQYLFGGPANLVFDSRGYAWITNNVVQGTGGSSVFNVVLKPNGKPSDGTNGTPKSPLFGGGILGAGFGIGLSPDGSVWMGNFGWGELPKDIPSADGNGSVSRFSPSGKPLSRPKAFQGGPVRAQATRPDASGNIWITSFDNDRVYVFPNGDPTKSFYYPEDSQAGPFDIQIAADGTAWVSNSGGLLGGGPSSVARYAISNGQLVQLFQNTPGGLLTGLKGIGLDSFGQAWVASQGGNCICLFSNEGELINTFGGGGMNSPWSTSIDGDDHVWIASFGPTIGGTNFNTSALAKLAGSNPATRPPGLNAGDPISPPTGYTLPSAGAEVLLHNGQPLYGPHFPPSFSPLQRITSVNIDQAGNIWAINNWKPEVDIDLFNPGGDGICIFVGLAKPPKRPFSGPS